jgi:ferredoxin/flavodoxin---NADP+ reductase
MASAEYNAVVTERIDVASGLMILRVSTTSAPLPQFKAGQYSILGMLGSAPRAPFTDPDETPPDPNKLIRRAYSAASSSLDKDYLEFYVTLVRSGALTPRLFALQRGDALYLGPKMTGHFTLDRVPPNQNLVLIATGTGLAPYMSLLRTHLVELRQSRVMVIHGARHSWDLGYRSELVTMQRLSPQFTYVPIISSPEEEPIPWGGRTGFIQDYWNSGEVERDWKQPPLPTNTHLLLCGNPKMIEAMVESLQKDGFVEHNARQPGQIHLERYW